MLKKKSSLRHTGAFWAFVAPCCILFGIFFLLPLVLSIAFSFTNYDGWKVMDFVGIKNYITLFKDSKFYASMGRTLVYTICCLPFRVIIPLLIAVLVTSPRVRLKSLSRTMIYIPVLMSALVVGITINWMFSQEYGLINFIIQSFGGTPLEWSLNSGLATFVIGFASVWASIGFNMIIYVGGINNISPDLYEAASIDGANSFGIFTRIMIPNAITVIVTVILFSIVWQYNDVTYTRIFFISEPNFSSAYGSLATITDQVREFLGYAKEDVRATAYYPLLKSAGTCIMMLPLIAFYAVAQKFFVQGVERSGIVG